MRGLAAVLLLLSGCAPAVMRRPPAVRADCGRGPGFDYCLYVPEGQPPSDTVLYFMHGGGESASHWGRWRPAEDLARAYRERGLPVPTVASISYGKLWVLTERGSSKDSGLLERFTDEAIPFIEAKTGAPKRRLLWGLSMGGFNAVQLLLKRPGLWASAVLSCPAVTVLAPTAGPAEVKEYVARTGADASKAGWMFDYTKRYFPDDASWARADPMRLAGAAGALPPVFLECGDRDEWGFFEGAERLAKTLEGGGHAVTFDRVAGGKHCVVDSGRVARFLLDR